MNWDEQDFQGPKLNPVPVPFASAKDVLLDAQAHLKQLEPVADLEMLALHVAQLTATVAEQQKEITELKRQVNNLYVLLDRALDTITELVR